tara:strand:- start:5563 stop:6405 length:843 start_codon:yes stop_codon:yes gene_type:complete
MNKVLGRGLDALIKRYDSEESNRYLSGQIPIEKIKPNPNQPRQDFNQAKLEELKLSIKKNGVLQPITVKELDDGNYEIIAGERRYRAAKAVGLQWIPAFTVQISNESEMMEYALIENIQRVDLNAIEEAEGYAILSGKHNLKQREIAERVSKSRTEISNKLRLLKLPPIIKDSLRNNQITYGHARALITIKKSPKMIAIFYKIINNKLSVRDTEKIIKDKSHQLKQNKNYSNLPNEEKKLQHYLSSKVSININKNSEGKIIINFDTLNKLKKIIKLIIDE